MDNKYDYPVNNYDMVQDLEMQRYNNRNNNNNRRYDYDRMYDYDRRYDNRYDNRYENKYDYRYDNDRYYRYPYCDRYGNCQNPIWWLFWPLFFM